jgi:SAM-dependent methyltransferase
MERTFIAPRALLFSAALAALFAAAAPASAQPSHTHRFGDAEKWAQVFDDPERDAWQKPREVIEALALAPDAIVADIGAGTGYFAVRFARVLPRGRVYGVDIEPDMVSYLAERARREGLKNVVAIAGAADDPRLPEQADLIVLVNVYHHIGERERYFRRLQSALKPGGRLAVIDFRLDSPVGPPRSDRVAPERVKSELARAGYRLAQEHDFLPNQYFLVFRPDRG